jgi:hypothetical protein
MKTVTTTRVNLQRRSRAQHMRGTLPWGFLILALTLGFSAPHIAPAAAIRSTATVAAGPGLPFAFADFNGDHRPDFASVQSGNRVSANGSEYSIWIDLSGSGRKVIRLVGPSGGLLIEARDVNGDHAVDLVLSTAWLRQPVAILLNDGHGKFSPVAPSAFPAAFSASKNSWKTAGSQTIEPIGLAQESSIGSPAQTHSAIATRSDSGFALFSHAQFAPASFVASRAGRAPPVSFLFL